MGCLHNFQVRLCMLFINRTKTMFFGGIIVILGITMIAVPNMELSEASNYDWTVTSSDESKFQDIVTDLMVQVDSVAGTGSESVAERSESASATTLMIVYQSKKGLPIFTPEGLKSMCEVESLLWDLEEFHSKFCQKTADPSKQMPNSSGNCSIPSTSLVPLFYEWEKSKSRECTLLSQEKVDSIEKSIMAKLKNPAMKPKFSFFMGENVDLSSSEPQRTHRTRSYLALGGPLPGFSSVDDRKTEQNKIYKDFTAVWEQNMFDYFGMKATLIKSAYRDEANSGPVNVRFFSLMFNNLEFGRVVNGDLMWTLASIVFVYFYIAKYTGSFYISSVAMFQIVLSLPITFFVYRFLYMIPFYTQLHILTIFLVLGVGADDVFVLTDAWKQAGQVPEFNEHTFDRLLYAYKRAFSAIFNTSFTTAMAFLSTSYSPIMPISAFGFYAATSIVVNYIYVVVFTPSALVFYHKYLAHRNGLCIKKGNVEPNVVEPITYERAISVDIESLRERQKKRLSSEEKMNSLTNEKKGDLLQRFFEGPYAAFITNKVVAVVIVVVFTIYLSLSVYFCSQLTTPETQEEWFTKDHMSTGIMDLLSDGYLAGPDDSYVKASIVYGVEDLDRGDFVKWYPADNRGTSVFNPNFDISSSEAHAFMLQMCEDVQKEPCDASGCNGGTFARPNSVKCWIKDFQDESGGSIPTGENFLPALQKFRKKNPMYGESIGFVDGKLKFVRLKFTLSLLNRQPHGKTDPVNTAAKDLIKRLNDKAPSTFGTGFVDGGRQFAWTKTEEGLVNGMFMGLAICFPVAFGVLLVATGNLYLSLYAIICIAGIVAAVLGFCQAFLGWYLGIAESIAAVIVIGFSVDYVVHLGHTYRESLKSKREERVKETLQVMGSTVAAGGVTTFGAGACMFGCQMVFFSKMAALISLTIALSLLFSLMYFIAICAVLGPEKDEGKIPCLNHGNSKQTRKV